jgi:hypothetical protein
MDLQYDPVWKKPLSLFGLRKQKRQCPAHDQATMGPSKIWIASSCCFCFFYLPTTEELARRPESLPQAHLPLEHQLAVLLPLSLPALVGILRGLRVLSRTST